MASFTLVMLTELKSTNETSLVLINCNYKISFGIVDFPN